MSGLVEEHRWRGRGNYAPPGPLAQGDRRVGRPERSSGHPDGASLIRDCGEREASIQFQCHDP